MKIQAEEILNTLQEYLNQIFAKFRTGDAAERTYYPVLENLLKKIEKGSEVIVESRNSSVGIPDFKAETSKGLLIGYIEAKDLGRDLDRLNKGEQEQIEKYLREYPKLIVTNFIEFRLYEKSELVDSAIISQPVTLKLGTPVLDNEGRFKGLLESFFSTTIPKVYTSKRLSELLAHKTRVLRDLIREEININDNVETNTEKLLKTFQKTLKPDMDPDRFSDMYAQTITFGLFVARINSDSQEFNRYTAHTLIPQTIPLLKKVFWVLSGQDVPQHIEWQVDEIAEILANTEIRKITEEFFKHGKGRDPIIHFYETFLSEYDSKQREELGVYYTPPQVVSYITKSLNKLLKKYFSKNDGFADKSVIVLDPAAGTLTFPAEAISIAKEEFVKKHGGGGWNQLVKEHILKNFYAFEILMAPYAVGHLKISLLLKELGYQLENDERFELYLTNTLDMTKFKPQQELLAEEISVESEKAYEVKDKIPVLVIMGNPPYQGESQNKGDWIMDKMKEYKQIEGESLGERNPKWLNDDYVKFFRFAQWKIEKTGQGILGFITNHGWLDNPTFRGMRYSLMKTFDEIYILNLHGSALKKEIVPNDIQRDNKIGKKDEGVFGIRPGTSITLGIKFPDSKNKNRIFYSDLWGEQKKKLEWLENNYIDSTKWHSIKPIKPHYLFVLKDNTGSEEFEKFINITDIFNINSVGIVTSRDHFVIDFDKKQLENRIRTFINSNDNDEIVNQAYKLRDSNSWNASEAKKTLRKVKDWEEHIYEIQYRPFDKRWIFYHPSVIERSRQEVMHHLINNNLGLLCTKKVEVGDFKHAYCTDLIMESHSLSLKEINYVFPLFIYKDNGGQQNLMGNSNKSANIHWKNIPTWLHSLKPFTSKVTDKIIQPPEAIFYYVYAVLYSEVYRKKYDEFLKRDFPNIPFTSDCDLFKTMVVNGEQLIDLHLLRSKMLKIPKSQFQGNGDSRVEKKDYDLKTNRVYLNKTQYFDKVDLKVWEYIVGGYRVLDQWLKYRKGKILTTDEQLHFRKIITALRETIEVQKRIDKLYLKVERSLVLPMNKK